MAKKGPVSAKTIWGKVVLFLREHKNVALHVACGDITNVSIEENNLVVHTQDSMIADLLGNGRREIENALRWQGLDIGFRIDYRPREKTAHDKDIEILKEKVGDYLIIK